MTKPYLALEHVSYALPDGRQPFADLSLTLDERPTALLGRNGVGKTLLARLLAGDLTPSSGRRSSSGRVHYLAQEVALETDTQVADLTGLRPHLDALARIEAGVLAPDDFDILGERWDVRQRLTQALAEHGLAHLEAETPLDTLSGGERVRVALLGAWLSDADFLILDEPSNHLDHASRTALIQRLKAWRGGLLVISHDRRLLRTMAHILELSPQGLRHYGCGYDEYLQNRRDEQEQAVLHLERAKAKRRREEAALREQQERQAKRQAQGVREGKGANQAKLVLDRQKESSQRSTAALQRQRETYRARLDREVEIATRHVAPTVDIALHGFDPLQHARRHVLALDAAVPPFGGQPLDLLLGSSRRVGVIGPNGCGKSVLLKVVAGQLAPLSGRRRVNGDVRYLDQHLSDLQPLRSTLDQARSCNPSLAEHEWRTRLAQLGLDASRAMLPTQALSGGERLKAALAMALYADPTPALLVLDEPDNHLDLPSLQALENLLGSYPGVLLVVSHDQAFLDQLQLTDRLRMTPNGWRLEPW